MDTVIHERCDCLDKICYKRRITVYTPFDNRRIVDFKFCNTYLSLRIQNNEDRWCGRFVAHREIEAIIKECFDFKESGLKWDRYRNYRDVLDRSIYFTICEKPYLYVEYTVREAIEKILESGVTCQNISNKVCDIVLDYLLCDDTLKKYKTKYKEAIAFAKAMKKGYYIFPQHVEKDYLELMCKLLNLNIAAYESKHQNNS